jgi:hypothetical protein
MAVSVAAAAILVAGAVVAVTVGAPGAVAQESDRDTPEAVSDRPQVQRGDVLAQVLAGLVADGTLDRAQADAVETALREAAVDRRPLRRAARRGAQAGYRLGRLLADDVIDADELATLGDHHPLRDPDGPAADYLDDGRLTIEELRAIRREWKESHGRDG